MTLRIADDEGLVSIPAPGVFQSPAPEILLEKPAEGVRAVRAVVEPHRPQGLLQRRARHQAVVVESLIPATHVVDGRVDGAASDEAVERMGRAGDETLSERSVVRGAVRSGTVWGV